jgi:bacterioferritin-associated ferredoxin
MDRTCSTTSCTDCPIKVVCRCLKVTEDEIVRAITALEAQTLRDLRRATGAGDGCTCCHGQLKTLINQHSGTATAVCG